MAGSNRWVAAALFFVLALSTQGAANAGLLDALFPDTGSTPGYSPFRYWAPGLGRIHDDCRGPKLNVHAPDRHPEISHDTIVLRYRRPPVAPGATIIHPPSAPPESRFRY